jgi:tetratricopeptide (TPR) repeat protein
MATFKKNLVLCVCILSFLVGRGQQAAAVDSIRFALNEAKSDEDKIFLMDNLSKTLMSVNLNSADSMGQQLIEFAEETRKRKLMVQAYVSNGTRCSYFAGTKNRTQQAIEYFNKALSIARENKLEDEIGGVQLRLSQIYLTVPDRDKALGYVNQAFSVISTLTNDSLKAEGHNTYGLVYLAKNEKILALRHYLNALRIAEEIKNDALMRSCYHNLSRFYSGIEAYDKAIDYATLAYKKLDDIKERYVPYQRVTDVNTLGSLYSAKKNYDMAISYFERSLSMADSLKFSTLKMPAYTSLLNQYIRMDQPDKALSYFNSSRGQHLQSQLRNFGLHPVIDQAYGVIYTSLNRYDSAEYHFKRATEFYEKGTNENNKMNFYQVLGRLYEKKGDNLKAIDYYSKVKELAQKNGALEYVELSAKHLDSLFAKAGNYQMSSYYNSIYYKYKDSTEKLNKEKELAQVEAADEQLRQERIEKELAERKRRKNNIQYMSITIGIVAFFILLVVLGMFRVSANTIKFIGFFAFLIFFEFIFLIFKKNINSITNGEPLKDLAFMIGLAALLVPLHHWMEKKVLHYLTSHNRLTAAGGHLKLKFLGRRKSSSE